MANESATGTEVLLRRPAVPAIITGMETEQVRLPKELLNDVRVICGPLGESAPEFIAVAVRERIARQVSDADRNIDKLKDKYSKPKRGKSSGAETGE